VITVFLLVIWITPYGAGVSPDSTTYISGAKSILSGNGFSIDGNPITHFPPLYSLFLVAMGLFDSNLVHGARILNALIFGINMGLVALAVFLTAGRNFLTATFAALLFLSSASLLEIHSMAWSEPLFITFTLACLILLAMYVIKPTLSLFIASSLFMGFALVTRYIGVAFLPAALVIVFIGGGSQKLGRRLRDTFIWLILACTPLVILSVRNMMLAGTAADRSFVFHPLSVPSYATDIIKTVLNFFAPIIISPVLNFITPISLPAGVRPAIFGLITAIFGLITAFLVALLVILFKRHLPKINWRSVGFVMTVCCLLFFLSYLLFLFISISFVDADTPVDTRLLSPILTILIVGLFSGFWFTSQMLEKQMVWWVFLVFIALSIALKTSQTIWTAVDIQQNGLGYTSRQWQDSETMAFVKLFTEDVKIYSNGSDVIDFLTDKQSLSIPRKIFATTTEVNPRYNEEVEIMCKDVTENKALVVYFNLITWREYLPTEEELMSTCKLPVLQSFEDGVLLGKEYR
jgi:hypothetical protein